MTGLANANRIAAAALGWAIDAGLALLLIGMFLTLWRAARGPRMPDRIAALFQTWLISMGLAILVALRSHNWRSLDLALALALLSSILPLAWSWAKERLAVDDQGDSDTSDTSNEESPHAGAH